MAPHDEKAPVERRTFIGRVTTAAGAILAALGAGSAVRAYGTAPSASGWQPARHPQDDWYEETPAKHRMFIDTTTATGLMSGMAFTRNFLDANQSAYGLADADSAAIVCLRHHSTSFAFSDAMWAKYAASLSERSDYTDPESGLAPTVNTYEREGAQGVTLSKLAKRGVRYAVCSMATKRIAASIADKTGAKADAVFTELTQHLVPGCHMVPAGIVAVNRSQERGYTLTTVA